MSLPLSLSVVCLVVIGFNLQLTAIETGTSSAKTLAVVRKEELRNPHSERIPKITNLGFYNENLWLPKDNVNQDNNNPSFLTFFYPEEIISKDYQLSLRKIKFLNFLDSKYSDFHLLLSKKVFLLLSYEYPWNRRIPWVSQFGESAFKISKNDVEKITRTYSPWTYYLMSNLIMDFRFKFNNSNWLSRPIDKFRVNFFYFY